MEKSKIKEMLRFRGFVDSDEILNRYDYALKPFYNSYEVVVRIGDCEYSLLLLDKNSLTSDIGTDLKNLVATIIYENKKRGKM